jgi:hypothetical protein
MLDCSNEWIKCQTSDANTVYEIDNNGYDSCKLNKFSFIYKFLNIMFNSLRARIRLEYSIFKY